MREIPSLLPGKFYYDLKKHDRLNLPFKNVLKGRFLLVRNYSIHALLKP